MDAFSCGGGRHKWLSVAVNNSHFSFSTQLSSRSSWVITAWLLFAMPGMAWTPGSIATDLAGP